MNPPPHVNGVYLKNDKNNFTIYFKDGVSKSEKELNQFFNKEELLTWILNQGKELKFSQDINNHSLDITSIKVLNILGASSKLGEKSKKFNICSLKFNYQYSFLNNESAIYKGKLIMTENNKEHPPIDNVIIKCTYSNKNISFSMSYFDNDETTNNMKKVQLAHSIRNMIVPFKESIC